MNNVEIDQNEGQIQMLPCSIFELAPLSGLISLLDFVSLTTVANTLQISSNGGLTSIALPLLSSVGTLLLTDNIKLVSMTCNALTSVSTFELVGNSVFTTPHFPVLATIDTFLVQSNLALASWT